MHYISTLFLLLCYSTTIAQTKTFQDTKFIYKLITSYTVDEERKDTTCFVKEIIIINKTSRKVIQKIKVPDNGFFAIQKTCISKLRI